MADVTKIRLPDNSEYNLKDYRIPGVDTTPTPGSDNVVTSGGVYDKINDESLVISTALNDLNNRLLDVEENTSEIDETPTEDSTNLVTSGGVYTAIIENEIVTASALNNLNERVDNIDEIVGDGTDFVKVPDYEDDQEVVARAINDLNDRVTIVEDDSIIAEPFSEIDPVSIEYYTKQEVDDLLSEIDTEEIDPVFSASPAANITNSDITNWNNKTNNTGTVTQVNVGSTSYNPSSGVVSLPAYPTTLPASDVSAWAKASTKPTYTASEVGALPSTTVIPAAPGTLTTTSTTALSTATNEALSGSISLHKVAKTGTYNDLIGRPTIPAAQVQSDWNATSGMGVILNKPTIPAAVTDSTVSGWGYIKSYTETDPVFSASAAAGITASDITNWNGKTSNTGTVTGVKINGTTKNPTSGVVDLGTVLTSYTETDPTVPSWAKAASKPTYTASEVGALPDTTSIPTESTVSGWGFTKNAGTVTGVKINGTTKTPTSGTVDLGTVLTSETALSKGTTTGSGNAVTDISVSGHQITLTKGSTFLTSETSLSKGTTTGSGNAVTDISVSGHQITLTKGTTFLTSHQDISGKANLSGAAFTGAVTGTSSGNASQFRNVTISSSEPTASDGNNGDIWIVI